MALRQTTGFVESLLRPVGLDWAVPDSSTLGRRQKSLAVTIPYRGSKGPLHVLVDNEALSAIGPRTMPNGIKAKAKAKGEGERHARKHGGAKRRPWRKIHLGVDEQTLEIRAIEVTGSSVGDAPMLPELLGQIPADVEIGSVTADGACDTRKCHDAIADRGAHPRTGAAQIVEIRETVQEIMVPTYVHETITKPPLFNDETVDTLLDWGVPEDWLDTVREATEDTVLDIAAHLPEEAQQALLSAAVGERPEIRIAPDAEPFNHPDAQRRFRVIGDEAELAAALKAPWEDWAVFLHPAQQEFVDRDFNGPARVIGSAETGKTIVALHRAVRLAAEDETNRILLATFNEELAQGLAAKLERLTKARPDVADRITVSTLGQVSNDLGEKHFG